MIRKTTKGVEPFAIVDGVEVFLGSDGQLWEWQASSGQRVVASGGEMALRWAERNSLPESKLALLNSYDRGYDKGRSSAKPENN